MLAKALAEISDKEMYAEAVGLVAQKAFSEPNFSGMYAELCVKLNTKVQYSSNTLLICQPEFKRALLNRCQEQFERTAQLTEAGPDGGMALDDKKKKLGNIRFVGELFKHRMLPEKIVHVCCQDLLRDMNEHLGEKKLLEDYGELLCQLMKTVGKYITDKALLDSYMDAMTRIGQVMNQLTRCLCSPGQTDQLSTALLN